MATVPSRTPRLSFRVWRPDDFALARSLWGCADVMAFTGGALDDEQLRHRLQQEHHNLATHGTQYFVLERTAASPLTSRDTTQQEGEGVVFVGCCGLRRDASGESGSFELGFYLLPAFWGQGLAGEAALSALAWAFRPRDDGGLGACKVVAGHHPRNEASAKVITQQLRLRHVGEVLYPPTNLLHPTYSVTQAEFLGQTI
eukprot:gnl/Spiro4/10725_TR5715_c0_g2_i1.p1 gnl/Spiro4/10725_TR5715_c0_g2~~gnl/Spiro4/10725_TR5715_c0_g2_i1.p1  ORF type:complete len:209 (-),score=57.18 gnl/Spiro4/10725_TR5715_c0_g2_i1:42-641(-)